MKQELPTTTQNEARLHLEKGKEDVTPSDTLSEKNSECKDATIRI
jgi:hypothetical protein